MAGVDDQSEEDLIVEDEGAYDEDEECKQKAQESEYECEEQFVDEIPIRSRR